MKNEENDIDQLLAEMAQILGDDPKTDQKSAEKKKQKKEEPREDGKKKQKKGAGKEK